MKLRNLLLVIAAGVFVLQSCSDDDDNSVSSVVKNAFASKYPTAENVDWHAKNSYQVASFMNSNVHTTAWFDAYGIWHMSETDIPYASLPQSVKTAFENSDYATWKVDDVDKLERKDSETVYVIEVEQQNKEVDLYYSSDGILIKAVVDNDDDDHEGYLPSPVASEIETFIKEKYPQARIIEIEQEKNMIEVDIIDGNLGKEVYFDLQKKWLFTSWEVHLSTLPDPVVAKLNSAYVGYIIDDADFIETSTGNYYLLELEKGNSEIKVKIDALGNVIS